MDLTNATTAEIQNELFERGMVAIPLDWLTDVQRSRLIAETRESGRRDLAEANQLAAMLQNRNFPNGTPPQAQA